MDLHHNLFYGYRGPVLDEGDRERQLENNLTKALLNTLSLGGRPVWQPFLAWIGIDRPVEAFFLLQRRDLPGRAALRSRRILLGLTPARSAWQHAEQDVSGPKSLPDAWIFGAGF